MTQQSRSGRFLASPPDPSRFQQDTPPERRSAGQVVLAALALLVLVVGVPVALWVLSGPPPFPDGWPTREDLTAPIGVETLLTVLRAVVWIAWFHFLVCVVAEFSSAVRGRGVPRAIPLGGGSQQLARILVSALLLTGIAAGQAAAATGGGAPVEPRSQVSISATTATTQAPATESIQPIDHNRFEGHTAEAGTKNPLAGKKVYTVKAPVGHHHDSLWDIAEKHLGDGRRYKEIYELNKERVQPDGQHLHLARLIMPGWELIMPEDAVGVPRVPTETPAKTTVRTTEQTGQNEQGTQTPRTTQGEEKGISIGGESGGGSGAVGGSGDHSSVDGGQTQDSRWRLPNDLLGGGLVGAGLLMLLLVERYRRRGRDPEAAATAAEVALRVGADPARSDALDRVMRALVRQCEAAGMPLPSLFGALVDDNGVELLLAPAQETAPAPWVALDNGRRWRIARADIATERSGPAPFPALVCLGRDEYDRDVLVDLEAASGALSLEGDTVVAREVATSVAVQLATNPWTDLLRVTTSGLPDAIEDVLADRLRVVNDIDEVLPDLEQGTIETEVLSGRVSRSADASPQYVVLGAPPNEVTAQRLTALASRTRAGFGLMVAGTVAGARWQLRVDESGTLRIPALGLTLSASRLSEPTVESLTELLAAARTPSQLQTGQNRIRVPNSGRPGDDASWWTANVRIGVLGPMDIRATNRLEAERLPLATEIVAFLALHPGGVHPSVLGASIWPRGVTNEVRDSTVERVRQWLGTDATGAHHLRQDSGGRLYLGPEVAVDWDCFTELVRRSRTAQTVRDERELLRRGLQLVRGPFLSGRPRGGYSWIARVHLERLVPDVVVDASHRLWELTMGGDDPAGAVSAVQAGLRLADNSDLLWRDLLTAEHRYGGVPAAEKVVEALGERIQRHGLILSPETEALIEDLLPASAPRSRHAG
ncbi:MULTISPECIES: BTAD domain-containing putative transcriptional regulator [unclassified Kribbella]|uniref:BTAD domain-containing putative transcriptional regulator n=1 Tax=unclassified Kribbella TaxID=2644121 RepID=UPI003016D63E